MRLRWMSTSTTRTCTTSPAFTTSWAPSRTVGELGEMDEAVLMHADVDEGAEGGDIGDGAFEPHARLQVLDVVDPVREGRGPDSGRGSRPGFSSSARMSRTVGRPKRSSTKSARVERLQRLLVAHQGAQVAPAGGDDLLARRRRLRDGRPKRPAARRRRGCAGSLRIARRRAGRAGYFQQFLAARERPRLVSVRDDRFRQRRAEPGDAREQRRRGSVTIDADAR